MENKEKLGVEIKKLRKEEKISTYALQKKGIHPTLPGTIEGGKKGYSIDTLFKYLRAINVDIFLSVGKNKKNK